MSTDSWRHKLLWVRLLGLVTCSDNIDQCPNQITRAQSNDIKWKELSQLRSVMRLTPRGEKSWKQHIYSPESYAYLIRFLLNIVTWNTDLFWEQENIFIKHKGKKMAQMLLEHEHILYCCTLNDFLMINLSFNRIIHFSTSRMKHPPKMPL